MKDELAVALTSVADAITPHDAMRNGKVGCLTEAVMSLREGMGELASEAERIEGVTEALNSIAQALYKLGHAVLRAQGLE